MHTPRHRRPNSHAGIRRTAIASAVAGLALATLGVGTASADPIDCPPGQAATFNPSEGGWVCVNNGGNTNNSEDPKNPNAGKGDYQH
jgi:hypothetical protein